MNNIFVEHIEKTNKTIRVIFRCDGEASRYFNDFVCECGYESDVENVPDSIAIIPFVSNVLPILFLKNFSLYVDEIDQSFYNNIDKYREAYSKNINREIPLSGKVITKKIVNNFFGFVSKRSCLLFSGGIDAICSLIKNIDTINDCITIFGADVSLSNKVAIETMEKNNKNILSLFGKSFISVKSNFREYINYQILDREIYNVDYLGWYHGFQHGIALLGQIAPLVFLNKYGDIYIASSYTFDYQPVCASNIYSDPCFSVCNCVTHHDGVELDRCCKVKFINDWLIKENFYLNIHVCWQDVSGNNCGICEKCLRSYLNCRCVDADYKRMGLISRLNNRQIKKNFFLQEDEIGLIMNRIKVFGEAIKRTYIKENSIPCDIKWLYKCYIDKNYFVSNRKRYLKRQKYLSYLRSFFK